MAAWLLWSGVAMCVECREMQVGYMMLQNDAKRIVMAACMLQGACVGEEAGAQNRALCL